VKRTIVILVIIVGVVVMNENIKRNIINQFNAYFHGTYIVEEKKGLPPWSFFNVIISKEDYNQKWFASILWHNLLQTSNVIFYHKNKFEHFYVDFIDPYDPIKEICERFICFTGRDISQNDFKS